MISFKIKLIAILFVVTNSVNAQTVSKGTIVLNPYLGAPNFGVVLGKVVKKELENRGATSYFDVEPGVGPNGIRAEFLINDKLSIGVDYIYNEVNGSGYVDSTVNNLLFQKYTIDVQSKRHRFLVRSNYHFLESNKIDLYGSVGLGLNIRDISVNTNIPKFEDKNIKGAIFPVSGRVALGFSYYPIKPIGLNFELGLGGPIVSAGIVIKFNTLDLF